MLKIVLFDIDDTLLDHRNAELQGIAFMYETYFQNRVTQNHFQELWLEVTRKHWNAFKHGLLTFQQQRLERIKEIWHALGISLDDTEALELFDVYLKRYQECWRPFPGIADLLRELRVETGILSNGSLQQQSQKLKMLKLLPCFNAHKIFTSDELGIAKPALKLFLLIGKLLELKPAEILYIGDSLELDIQPALQVGWQAILLDHHKLYPDATCIKVQDTEDLRQLLQRGMPYLF